MWNREVNGLGSVTGPTINDNMVDFKMDKNIDVSYDVIYANTYEEYLNKLNVKLYKEKGPTLIYFHNGSSIKNYIEQGIALDIEEDKVPNIKKLYKTFKKDDNYYIPIGINYPTMVLNKPMLDRLNIKRPNINWSRKDFLYMKNEWLESQNRTFNSTDYLYTVRHPYYELEVVYEINKKIKLNNDKVKKFITKARNQLFSGDYIFMHDSQFYYNAIFEYKSDEFYKEYKERKQYNEESLIASHETENALKVREDNRANGDYIHLPNIYNKRLNTFGFIVNKRGKNIELGLEFINELLSNKNQMKVYKDQTYWFYPVNKEIEDKINEVDRGNGVAEKYITMRKHVLDKIKSGDDMNYLGEDVKVQYIRESIEKDFFKIIFSDEEYTDEELENKLIEMENKYQLYFRE